MSLLLLFGGSPDFEDGALAATGTATTSFVGVGIQSDGALSATGTGLVSFIGVDATPPANVVPGGGEYVHRGSAYWRQYLDQFRRKKKRKKKVALSELDELIVTLQAQVAPWNEAKAYEAVQADYRKAIADASRVSVSDTLDHIELEVAYIKSLLAEIDDEETILLLM